MFKKIKFFLKKDFNFFGEYDLELKTDEELAKIRVWGLPWIHPSDPVPLGIAGGLGLGSLINYFRRRPMFSSKFAFFYRDFSREYEFKLSFVFIITNKKRYSTACFVGVGDRNYS